MPWSRGLTAATKVSAVEQAAAADLGQLDAGVRGRAAGLVPDRVALAADDDVVAGRVSTRSATWFAIVPLGSQSAASWPSSAATRSCSALTVGSSPYWSSPTGAPPSRRASPRSDASPCPSADRSALRAVSAPSSRQRRSADQRSSRRRPAHCGDRP
jgi:hypothetical protein